MKYLKTYESQFERQYYSIPIKGASVAMKRIGVSKHEIDSILRALRDFGERFENETHFYIDNETGYWDGPFSINTKNNSYYKNSNVYSFKHMGTIDEPEDYEIEADKYNM